MASWRALHSLRLPEDCVPPAPVLEVDEALSPVPSLEDVAERDSLTAVWRHQCVMVVACAVG